MFLKLLNNIGGNTDTIDFFNKVDLATQKFIINSGKLNSIQLEEIRTTAEWTDGTNGVRTTLSGLAESELDAAIQAAAFSTAEQKATASTLGLGTATKGLLATMKAHPFMSITTAVGIVIGAYSSWKQHQEQNRQAAEDTAQTYAETSKAIEDYSKRYGELRTALLNAKGNEEETYNIKKQLLDLQKELNDKYGDEYGKLNLVTDAYRDQTEAIKNLNKETAQKYLNENEADIRTANKKMTEDKHYNLSYTGLVGTTEEGKALIEIAKKYEDSGVTLQDELGTGDYTQFSIHLNANAETAYETINAFETDVKKKAKELGDEHLFDDVIEISSKELNRSKSIIDGYGKRYIQALTYEIVVDDNLSPQYNQAIQAVQDYNEALLKSDTPYNDESVITAYNNLKELKSVIYDNEEEWGKYSSVIDTVFDQADTKLIGFTQKLQNNWWGIGDLTSKIKEENYTDTDLKALWDSGQAGLNFIVLAARAQLCGVAVDELIPILTQLDIVQKDLDNDIPELNVIKNKEEMISSINQLSEGFESLDRIMSSIGGSDPFDFSLLTDSKFKDTFGDLGDSYTDFIDTISNSPKDINACQAAFNELITAWLNSDNVLSGISDDTVGITENMLQAMGVVNADQIAQNALAKAKAQTAWETQNLNVRTAEGIQLLAEEAGFTGEAEKAFISYLVQKLLAETPPDVSGDISALANIVDSLGIATSAWQKYYTVKARMAEIAADPNYVGTDDFGNPVSKETVLQQYTDIANMYQQEAIEELEAQRTKAIYNIRKFSPANTGSSKSPQSTELDLAAESVNNLKQHLDLLTTDLENTDPYSEKLPILKELIQTQEAYNNALQSQADLYYDEYQKSLQSLPQDLQEKISGYDSFSIETIPETLKDAVSKAQSYRDKWNSATISIKQAGKELENLRLKQMDLAQARLDDKIGVVQNKAADIQNQMDEAEAMGLNATSEQYRSLIRLSRQEEKYNQNKLTGLQAELLLLDEDEDAYYDCLGAIQDCENAISKCAQNQAAYNKAILELPIQYLEKANDSLNDELDELQDKQDDLDSAIAGVTGHLQDQIEAQQTLRDEAEETAQKQIDAIQDEIDGLQKANDERKQQLDLEEKLYNLERAKNQKTTRIFRESEGGFVYEADSEAVRNAQNEYEDALFEQTISDMEDKIRDIEESRDALLESYDLEIDRLQKIVESWDGITEAIQRAKDMTMAGTILGSGWQDRVTSGDTGDLENASGQYEKNDREQTWAERQIEENERLIRQVEDYIEAWQTGQITIREAREEINDIVSDVMPEIEANDERVSSLSTYTSAWSNAQTNVADSVAAVTETVLNNVDELLATDARRQAVFDYATEWANSALAVGGALGSINEANAEAVLAEGTYLGQRISNLSVFQGTYSTMASSISKMCHDIITSCKEAEKALKELSDDEDRYGYGQGTTHARPGLHRVAEGNRPEIIIRNSGAAFLAKRETHYPFAGGETVLNPSDTGHVLRGDHLEPIDAGLPVLKDQQTRSLIDTLGQNAPLSISGMPEAFSPSAGLTAGNVRQENVVVNFGDVNLPQVKDVDTFTRAIADGTLKSALQQRLMRNK